MRVRTEPPLPGYRHYLDEEDVLTFIQLLPEWNDLSAGLREIVLADHDDACDGWYRDGRVGICAWVDAPRFEAGARWVVEHRELLDDLGVNVHRGDGTFVKAFAADPLGVPVQERGDVRAAMAEVFGVDVLEVHPGDDCAWIAVAPASTDHPAVELCDIHLIDGELHAYERTYSCRFTPAQVRAYQLLHVLTHEIGHHRDAMTRPHRGLVARGESFAEQWAYRCGREVWTRYFSELAR